MAIAALTTSLPRIARCGCLLLAAVAWLPGAVAQEPPASPLPNHEPFIPTFPSVQSAPWVLETLDGEEVFAEAFLPQPTAVIFWASWSPRCKPVFAEAKKVQERWQGRWEVVLVNFQEDPSVVRRFAGEEESELAVLLDRDGTLARRYRVETLPTLILFQGGRGLNHGPLAEDVDRILTSALQGASDSR